MGPGPLLFAIAEGEILTMPQGAVAYDLENILAFLEYIAANMEKWYKFVNGIQGQEAKNNDVRLVIGCNKRLQNDVAVRMAALASISALKVSQIKFKAIKLGLSCQVN